jgi:GH24 family phage-related lysozyme (muramidase)
MPERAARCGAEFEHAWHAYRDGDGNRRVCDGQTRPIPSGGSNA